MSHQSVLLNELITGLNIKDKDGAVVVDATINGGGVSSKICDTYPGRVRIVGIDQDSGALKRASLRLADKQCSTELIEGNFRDIDLILGGRGIAPVDAVIMDLGLSANQLESSGRGFSFMKDDPLLMTFKENPNEDDLTAFDIVNEWDEENIAAIIGAYGEEKFAGRLAREIVLSRDKKEINSSLELGEIIKRAVPIRFHRKIHPATRTFQALRIAVNDEVRALEEGLSKSFNSLAAGGRLLVISFHSIEDRIVKNFMRDKVKNDEAELVVKKPITPSNEEIQNNPRSRSAKLRILQKR